MAQELRAHTSLPQTQSLIPSIPVICLTTNCNFSPRGIQHLQSHTHTSISLPLPHIIKIKSLKEITDVLQMLQTELQKTSQDLETKADTLFVVIVWATQKCLSQIHTAHSIAAEYTFHCTHRMFSKTDYVRSQYKSEET